MVPMVTTNAIAMMAERWGSRRLRRRSPGYRMRRGECHHPRIPVHATTVDSCQVSGRPSIFARPAGRLLPFLAGSGEARRVGRRFEVDGGVDTSVDRGTPEHEEHADRPDGEHDYQHQHRCPRDVHQRFLCRRTQVIDDEPHRSPI